MPRKLKELVKVEFVAAVKVERSPSLAAEENSLHSLSSFNSPAVFFCSPPPSNIPCLATARILKNNTSS